MVLWLRASRVVVPLRHAPCPPPLHAIVLRTVTSVGAPSPSTERAKDAGPVGRVLNRNERPISLLFDGTAMMRAAWSAGKSLDQYTLPDGTPAGALRHFMATLLRVLDTLAATHIGFVVDRKSVRKRALHPEYKVQGVNKLGPAPQQPWEVHNQQVGPLGIRAEAVFAIRIVSCCPHLNPGWVTRTPKVVTRLYSHSHLQQW